MGRLIRRAGFGFLLLSAVLYLAAASGPSAREGGTDPLARARPVAALGAAVVVLGLAVEALAGAGRRCPRCGASAVGGSVFCAHHRDELTQAARQARSDMRKR